MKEGCAVIIAIFLAILVLDFLCTAGLLWLICWAFKLAFSWKVVFGIWAIIAILQAIFKPSVHVNHK